MGDNNISQTKMLENYSLKSKLKSMKFFYDAVSTGIGGRYLSSGREKTVGYFCNLVPEEVIIAAGCIPVRLCSEDQSCVSAGESIVPGDICPLIKSVCGAAITNGFEGVDLLVVPAACDGKIKLAEILSPYKDVYFLDLPKDSDYMKNADIWTDKYGQFSEFLSKRYNKKITRKELSEACRLTNKRTEIYRKIYKFRAENPGVMSSYDYFIMSYASFFGGIKEWIENAEKLYKELAVAGKPDFPAGKPKRILLSGSPIIFPNYKILEIIEDAGCDISADTLCSSYGRMYDPVVIDEETDSGILRAIALKYVSASMCPCFLGIKKLADRIIETAEEYKLDGVIYHNLRLCQVFEIQTFLIRQKLKERGIPFISIKTDFSKEDTGQLKTRIEAFIEMLG